MLKTVAIVSMVCAVAYSISPPIQLQGGSSLNDLSNLYGPLKDRYSPYNYPCWWKKCYIVADFDGISDLLQLAKQRDLMRQQIQSKIQQNQEDKTGKGFYWFNKKRNVNNGRK